MGTTFKVGDKVRRKREWRDLGWTCGNKALTVKSIDRTDCWIEFEEIPHSYVVDRFDLVDDAPSKVKSDGGSTSYYTIPSGATELLDLIEHKKMDFATANIFKACYRLGEKEGNDLEYDINKIIYFAERLKANLKKS